MKKLIKPIAYIIAVILIALFASTLTGCDDEDIIVEDVVIDIHEADYEMFYMPMRDGFDNIGQVKFCYHDINNNFRCDLYYTTEKVDERFEDILMYIQVLEQRIIELENEW